MKKIILYTLFLITFTSCIVEIELDPPYVNSGHIEEYETKEVINQVWSGGILVYEEAIYHAWMEIEFENLGGVRASNVWAEIIFYDGIYEIQTISIFLPDIRPGNTYRYTLNTGFKSIFDYSDYKINVYWE
jgi:hypothetical protein